jgi:hypothetical protein
LVARLSIRERLLLAGLVSIAAGLRLAAARGDLWLDEIWSLSFARELSAPWETLTAIHHDNNHPLNTLALFVAVKTAGLHAPSIAYRILPLLTGVATIPLLFWTERDRAGDGSHASAWLAALWGATSFLAVVYSSEARGYAPAAFFALAAFALVRNGSVESTPSRRIAFAACCVLGLLSHLTFLFPYAGIVAWTHRSVRSGRVAGRDWIALHALPALFSAVYYLIDVRQLTYGGGPPIDVAAVLGRTLSLAVNGPDAGWARNGAALAALGVALWGIRDLTRRNSDEAAFFAVALATAPAGVIVAYKTRILDPRYFFVLMPFFWLLAARALTRLRAHGTAGRAAATLITALAVAGGVVHLLPLLRDGRGHYREAVATLSALTPGSEIAVGSDHDFRNETMLDYYADQLPPGKRVIYVPASAWTPEGPEWLITHGFGRLGPGNLPPERVSGVNGRPYRRLRSFPYGGISGWNWHLYRREDPGAASAATSP